MKVFPLTAGFAAIVLLSPCARAVSVTQVQLFSASTAFASNFAFLSPAPGPGLRFDPSDPSMGQLTSVTFRLQSEFHVFTVMTYGANPTWPNSFTPDMFVTGVVENAFGGTVGFTTQSGIIGSPVTLTPNSPQIYQDTVSHDRSFEYTPATNPFLFVGNVNQFIAAPFYAYVQVNAPTPIQSIGATVTGTLTYNYASTVPDGGSALAMLTLSLTFALAAYRRINCSLPTS